MSTVQVTSFSLPIFREANESAERTTTALFGEHAELLEQQGIFAKVRLIKDGYEGFASSSDLSHSPVQPTHKCCVLGSFIYERPDIKSAVLGEVPFQGEVMISGEEGDFFRTPHSGAPGYLVKDHFVSLEQKFSSPLLVAKQFLGSPYLWGGKTSHGLDCSSLVQLSLMACGVDCPRDSGPQKDTLGQEVAIEDRKPGDLLFYKRHVAFIAERDLCLHASAGEMVVYYESFDAVQARYGAKSGFEVLKRL